MTDWNTLAKNGYANSARWFPNLHAEPIRAAMHFFVGFIGELGEFLDEFDYVKKKEELADCLIYVLDLAGAYGVEIDPADVDGYAALASHNLQVLVIDFAVIANRIKKQNRLDALEYDEVIAVFITRLLGKLQNYAEQLNMDITHEIERKTIICNDRWGWPEGIADVEVKNGLV